ncbi:MAG TPA: glycosyltransferase, partial [Candidatus Sulfotelmatobacter sp.]
MKNSCGISIVIPAYNESARLGPTLDRVLDFVRQLAWDAELIVVDDGSRDRTAGLVRDCARVNPMVQLVQNPGNRGKGYNVRHGVLHAQGAIVLFTDADLSSPIEEAPKLFDAIAAGADIASSWGEGSTCSCESCWAWISRIRSVASRHSVEAPQRPLSCCKESKDGALIRSSYSSPAREAS